MSIANDNQSIKKPFVVGLTGGIASGKTAVSDYLQTLGIEVVDADVVARQVVEVGSVALGEITKRYGQKILNPDASLNRDKLRKIVFSEEVEKQWLNNLTHPLVRELMSQQINAVTSAYAVLSVPLLIENGMHRLVDRVLVVDTPEHLQLSRGAARDNNSQQQIQSIMQAQATRQQRLELADDIVVNDKDLMHLYGQVDKLHKNYLTLALKTG